MSALDQMPDGREDESVRHGGARGRSWPGDLAREHPPRPDRARARRAGRRDRRHRRSRTCSSTSSIASRHGASRERDLGGRDQGAPADSPRPPDAAHPGVRPDVLPVPVRLRAELRHPARRACGRGSRPVRRQPRLDRGLRAVHLLRRRGGGDVARRGSGLVDRGTARVVLVIPSDFARDIRERQTAEVQVIIDGDNANTATTVLGYVTAVLRTAAAKLGTQPAAAMATSSRASGTTRSCAARCSSCPASSRSSR